MKIIIELEGTREQQPEIKKITSQGPEQQQSNINSVAATISSPMDAGHARIPDGYVQETSAITGSQQPVGNNPSAITGAIDAGAARVRDENISAVAMPDTGNMETYNTGNVFSGGSFVKSGSN